MYAGSDQTAAQWVAGSTANRGLRIVLVLAGALLTASATLKLWSAANGDLAVPLDPLRRVWPAFELAAGLWLLHLGSRSPVVAWGLCIAIFSVFALESGWAIWSGRPCDCLGALTTSAWMPFLVDVAFLAALLHWRPASSQARAGAGTAAAWMRRRGTVFACAIVTLLALSPTVSPAARSHLLRGLGYVVAPDRFYTTVAIDDSDEGAFARFRLRNLATFPVSVLGVKTTCRCLSLTEAPFLVPPMGEAELRLRLVRTSRSQFGREERVLLFLDRPSPPVVLTVRVESS